MILDFSRQVFEKNTKYEVSSNTSTLILFPHPHFSLQSGLILSGFPIKTLYATLLSPLGATRPAHLSILYFVTRIYGEKNISQSSSLCSFLHSSVISSL
jgi:hypothetical protein